jgi:hypothetical protein
MLSVTRVKRGVARTWSEQYTTMRCATVASCCASSPCSSAVLYLAANSAQSTESEAVFWITPPPVLLVDKKTSGSASICTSQSSITCSSSVRAGEVICRSVNGWLVNGERMCRPSSNVPTSCPVDRDQLIRARLICRGKIRWRGRMRRN